METRRGGGMTTVGREKTKSENTEFKANGPIIRNNGSMGWIRAKLFEYRQRRTRFAKYTLANKRQTLRIGHRLTVQRRETMPISRTRQLER